MNISNKKITEFWDKVNMDGPTLPHMGTNCWVWIGSVSDEYGIFYVGGKTRRSHIVSWKMFTGNAIPEGFFVCHHCDNPPCVYPGHLYLGTPKDNSQDMINRGRGRKEDYFSFQQVKEIRSLYASGNFSLADLAKMFEVHRNVMYNIISGQTYRNAEGPFIKREDVLKGGRNSQAKLIDEQVREIKTLPPNTYTSKELADKYKVSADLIRSIATNEAWVHIEGSLILKPIKKEQQGSKNHMTILTEEAVRNIKIQLQRGTTGKTLSVEYGVSPMTISSIKNGRNWKHVTI